MKSKSKNRLLTYGFVGNADVVGSVEQISYSKGLPDGISFRVDENGSSMPVHLEGVFGKNHIYSALASLAFCISQKLNTLTAINALKSYDIPSGRMRLLSGINGSVIIDDTYNSSPFAVQAALETLGEITLEKGRKIAVLGDMLELGKHTEGVHKEMGAIAKAKADTLIVTGQRAKFFKLGALEAGMKEKNTFEFLNSIETGEFLKTFVKAGDIVLIKGSQGLRMERTVEAILLEQDKKSSLLARQDEEWLKR